MIGTGVSLVEKKVKFVRSFLKKFFRGKYLSESLRAEAEMKEPLLVEAIDSFDARFFDRNGKTLGQEGKDRSFQYMDIFL